MIGETLALGAALVWSISVILFRRSEAVSPLGMNLFKNTVGAALMALTMLALGIHFVHHRPLADWVRLAVSGVLGIGVADTLIFMALRRLGPGLLAIVDCAYAPIIVLVSVVFLGEHVRVAFGLGAVLVVLGVLVGTVQPGATALPTMPRAQVVAGVASGVLGIVSMAFGVILAKPPLEKSPLVEVTLVRLLAGLAAQGLWIGLVPRERAALAAFRPGPAWRTLVPASILSAYVSLLLWLGGFKWAAASTAAVLNQMSTVFTIVLARVVLGEKLTARRALGGALAVSGAVLVLGG